MTCFFCPPEADRIIGESTLCIAFWDKFPVTPGHALIIPKRHAETWSDCTPDEQEDIARFTNTVIRVIENRFPDDKLGFNLGVNVGKIAGQSVMHCHMHIIPRRMGDNGSDPRGGVRGVIPHKKDY